MLLYACNLLPFCLTKGRISIDSFIDHPNQKATSAIPFFQNPRLFDYVSDMGSDASI